MKRLRAPEQSESKPATPASSLLAAQTTADAPAPTAAVEGTPAVTEQLVAGEMSQQVPQAEAAASAEEPQEPQEGEPTNRCNGEASATLFTAGEAAKEQG